MASIVHTIRWASNTEELKRNLKDGLNQIEATRAGAERMVKALSGDKLQQAAHNFAAAVSQLGGVEKLTNAERERGNALLTKAIEKYAALGQQAPQALRELQAATAGISTKTNALAESFGTLFGAVTVGAVIGFGRSILDAADGIQKMSDQTGLTTAEVQKLSFIAGQSGSSVESLVGAVQNLQQRLGDQDAGAIGAIAKLNINLRTFSQANTFDQMLLLADALAGIKDPTLQASLAAEIFGKTWKEILPAIKSGMREVAEQAPIMADEAVKSLDRIGDAMTRAKQQATAWGANFVLAIEGAGFAVGDFLSKFNPEHFGVATSQILKTFGDENDPTGVLGAISKIKAATKDLPDTLKVPKLPGDATLSNIVKDLNDQLREQNRIAKESADAYRRAQADLAKWSGLWEPSRKLVRAFADELQNLTSFTFDLQEALDQVEMNARQIGRGFLELPNVSPSGAVPDARDAAAREAAERFQRTQDTLQSLGRTVAEFGSLAQNAFGQFLSGASNVIGAVGELREAVRRFGESSIAAALSALQLGVAIGRMLAPFLISLFSGPGAIGDAARRAAESAARRAGHAATGGLVTPFGIQRFAMGGIVAPSFPSFGTDTVPAMLTPGEVVLNRAQQQALATPVVHVHNDWRGAIVDADVYRRIARQTGPHIVEDIAQNKGGIYSRARAALGLRS